MLVDWILGDERRHLAQDDATGTDAACDIVVEADSADDVGHFVAEHPCSRAGLFERVNIRPWQCGLGRIEQTRRLPVRHTPQSLHFAKTVMVVSL